MKRFVVKCLLLPFSGLYGLITSFRNWLFDSKLLKSTQPGVYSICVGNLTVGGTGKTPMIEFLIKRYIVGASVRAGDTATLSRGYGRKTSGFRIATDADTAETTGDEPLQLYRKFSPLVRVCVGERRVEAIQTLLGEHPETARILLDDAFQHRPIRPHLNILLMDYNRPFYDDYPFPAGRLRERRNGARRADGIVVTKCPMNLWTTEQKRIIQQIRPYARPETPVFFAGLHYDQPVSFATYQPVANLTDVVLVSGLANAGPLEQYVRQTFRLHHHHQFADHYAYTRADLDDVLATLPLNTAVLTTEKDWVKLDGLLTPNERANLPLFYLPIAVQFLPGYEQLFTQFLASDTLKNR
ncbi:tetraacyldisaccharide 4'-kinase [Spirosoma validum]|uniref:Tetraacyldisaccharide 4'-kinase n=1 Tax=Spirosoma validum TaxID=2771355 RepID=A0A927B332_9BACT|nr:tetraacyldisaccharide 4'-kinase [Spirosoma validum]MBD2754426.1 tetraacyldisaccharide 4'-kinase [Spirosoma validum]